MSKLKKLLKENRLTKVFCVGQLCHPKIVEIVGVDGGFDDIRWRIEIRFANFQVDDVFALFFQRAGAVQNLEGGFGAEP